MLMLRGETATAEDDNKVRATRVARLFLLNRTIKFFICSIVVAELVIDAIEKTERNIHFLRTNFNIPLQWKPFPT